MCKIQSEELAFHLLCVLVLIQEKCLALAFAVDCHNHVRQGLHKQLYRLNEASYRNLLHSLGFLLIKFHIIQSNQVVSRQHEVEIFSKDK